MKILEISTRIGAWEFGNYASTKHLKHLRGIQFSINTEYINIKDIVYLFAIDEEIVYVGETSNSLKARLESYRYGNSYKKDTDNRVKIAITSALEENKKVGVYYIKPTTEYFLNGKLLSIPLSKPIEEYLISEIGPILNKKGN